MKNEELSPEPTEIEKFDHSLRPESLDDFIGQYALKDNLKIFIEINIKGRFYLSLNKNVVLTEQQMKSSPLILNDRSQN